MSAQSLIVSLLVPLCSVYAAWSLLPASARRAMATWLLGFNLPQRLAKPLVKAAAPASACGCSGCDHAVPAKASGAEQVVRIRRRIKP